MQIILLSGGSGKRLWPLSNNTRSKQFIRILPKEDGSRESMVQRVVRQLKESGISDSITVATSISQREVISNQLGESIPVVTEPERRDTFPAIALASSYLAFEKHCSMDETVLIMPCDPYTESGYFQTMAKMADALQNNVAELVLMGIKPTYPSSKFGYVVPKEAEEGLEIYKVARFTEKPDTATAEELIAQSAFWNGGVFAFRLGYMVDIINKYIQSTSFTEIRSRYHEFPKISFDYEVAEKAKSVAVVPFSGEWKDLGTWNALTDELKDKTIGSVVMDEESENTYVVNELDIPIMCLGAKNLVIAASPDGILVSEKNRSESIKSFADKLQHCPMFEEKEWGEYKVIHNLELPDGSKSMTKEISVFWGKSVPCQSHSLRSEVWTVVDGCGSVEIDGQTRDLKQGSSFSIAANVRYSVKAKTDMTFVCVMIGLDLREDDVEFF